MSKINISCGKISALLSTKGACIDELRFGGTTVGERGITVGRFANRIAGARIVLNGIEHALSSNENGNTLHGGEVGFDQREWQVCDEGPDRACFELVSEDGDQGFPGRVTVRAEYRLTEDSIRICYTAETDAPTVINLTNHLYFNLNGGGPAEDHLLKIDADRVLEVDEQLIPTGRMLNVRGTRFDHRRIRRFDPDFDCCYALNGQDLKRAAVLKGCRSRIALTLSTDQPGLQLYNTDTHICLETQHFPDSPHHPEFPDTTLLPEKPFKTETIITLKQETK